MFQYLRHQSLDFLLIQWGVWKDGNLCMRMMKQALFVLNSSFGLSLSVYLLNVQVSLHTHCNTMSAFF